jgi:hypothetical protein
VLRAEVIDRCEAPPGIESAAATEPDPEDAGVKAGASRIVIA